MCGRARPGVRRGGLARAGGARQGRGAHFLQRCGESLPSMKHSSFSIPKRSRAQVDQKINFHNKDKPQIDFKISGVQNKKTRRPGPACLRDHPRPPALPQETLPRAPQSGRWPFVATVCHVSSKRVLTLKRTAHFVSVYGCEALHALQCENLRYDNLRQRNCLQVLSYLGSFCIYIYTYI